MAEVSTASESEEVIVPSSVSPRRSRIRPRGLPRLEVVEPAVRDDTIYVSWRHDVIRERSCHNCHETMNCDFIYVLGGLDFCGTCMRMTKRRRLPRNWCSGCYDSCATGTHVFHCTECTACMCQPCFVQYLLVNPIFYGQKCKCPICKKCIDLVEFK